MVQVTNNPTNDPFYSGVLSGYFEIEIVSDDNGVYELEVYDLTDNPFSTTVNRSVIDDEQGDIDEDKLWSYLMSELKDAAADQTYTSSFQDGPSASYIGVYGDRLRFGVFGNIQFEATETTSNTYTLLFSHANGEDFAFTIDRSEEAVLNGINPSKLLKYLLKKLKEYLCPECL